MQLFSHKRDRKAKKRATALCNKPTRSESQSFPNRDTTSIGRETLANGTRLIETVLTLPSQGFLGP